MAASTPRKAAARRTPPAAARRPSRAKSAPDPVDILAEWQTEEKPPVPIKVGDIECEVLRGFSGAQAMQFNALAAAQKWVEVLELITTNGKALWDYVGQLTPEYASAILNKIITLSELYEGNFIAPLPGFGTMNPAGAQPSQPSTGTTE